MTLSYESYPVPPVVKPCVSAQPFPPPPLSRKERCDYRMSVDEIVAGFLEEDKNYPNMRFNPVVYAMVLNRRLSLNNRSAR